MAFCAACTRASVSSSPGFRPEAASRSGGRDLLVPGEDLGGEFRRDLGDGCCLRTLVVDHEGDSQVASPGSHARLHAADHVSAGEEVVDRGLVGLHVLLRDPRAGMGFDRAAQGGFRHRVAAGDGDGIDRESRLGAGHGGGRHQTGCGQSGGHRGGADRLHLGSPRMVLPARNTGGDQAIPPALPSACKSTAAAWATFKALHRARPRDADLPPARRQGGRGDAMLLAAQHECYRPVARHRVQRQRAWPQRRRDGAVDRPERRQIRSQGPGAEQRQMLERAFGGAIGGVRRQRRAWACGGSPACARRRRRRCGRWRRDYAGCRCRRGSGSGARAAGWPRRTAAPLERGRRRRSRHGGWCRPPSPARPGGSRR